MESVFGYQIEKEVPRGGKTNVVVAVVIPIVVDIETLRVEVTDIDTVAVRSHKVAYFHPCHWKLRFAVVYKRPISSLSCILFGSRQNLPSPLKTSKKFNLHLYSHAIVIRRRRYSGEVSKMRRPTRLNRSLIFISRAFISIAIILIKEKSLLRKNLAEGSSCQERQALKTSRFRTSERRQDQ